MLWQANYTILQLSGGQLADCDRDRCYGKIRNTSRPQGFNQPPRQQLTL
ncbi:hypothetical protein [Phormidium nigroviride]